MAIPDDLSYVGLDLYAQGVFLDLTGVAPLEPVWLTHGLAVTIGI